MARFQLDRIANHETLSAVAPALLREFLSPWSSLFEAEGVPLGPAREEAVDAGDAPAPLDCAAVSRVLTAETAELPTDLLDALYLISEMSAPSAIDAVREAASRRSELRDALAAEDLTDEDVAVLVYLRAPALLEELHVRRRVHARKSSTDFASLRAPAEGAHRAPPLDEAARDSLRMDLESGFSLLHKGRDVRVVVFEERGEHRYHVRHGERFHRVAAIVNGRSTHVYYRPETWDVVAYNPETGRLRVSAKGARVVDLYRRKFGLHLLGDEGQFPRSEALYTLAPLLEGSRALHCADIDGLEEVRLVGVSSRSARRPSASLRFKDDEDVFALLRAEGFALPRNPSLLLDARFRVRFRDGGPPRPAELRVPNVASMAKDGDARVFQKYLAARGYVRPREEEGSRAHEQATLAFA